MEHGEVQITCGGEAEAERIARALVDRRLAACVHLAPIRSFYEWADAVQDDREVLLIAMTRGEHLEAIIALVDELHSYDLPAVTMRPIVGSPAYLAWVVEQTTPST